MNKLLVKLYAILPKKTINFLGSLAVLKVIRDYLLRDKKGFKEATVRINKTYLHYAVNFLYTSSIKYAAKAKKSGVETKLLFNSFKLAKPGSSAIVLDVGSNFGFLSLVWAQTLASSGKVYSFEPNEQVFNCLNKSIKLNSFTNILTENMAVGSKSGETDIFINGISSNIHATKSSGYIKTVPIKSIDDYYMQTSPESCDLIKIDVDGYEYEVLQGAKHTLTKFEPLVIIETNGDQRIMDFMNLLNYKIYDSNLKTDFTGIPENIFCTH